MTLADYIKSQLHQRKMTLYRLSKVTGISYGYLDRIEKDIKKNPSYEILKKISVAFGVDVRELLSAAGYEDRLVRGEESYGNLVSVYLLSDYLHTQDPTATETMIWGDRDVQFGLRVNQVVDGVVVGDILLISKVPKVTSGMVVLLRRADDVVIGRTVKTRQGMVVLPLGGGESIEVDRDRELVRVGGLVRLWGSVAK